MGTASNGWDFSISVSVARPFEWPLFYHCASGRLDKVQQVLASKQGSLHDIDPSGHTPLLVRICRSLNHSPTADFPQYAAVHGHGELFRWLLFHGTFGSGLQSYFDGVNTTGRVRFPVFIGEILVEEGGLDIDLDVHEGTQHRSAAADWWAACSTEEYLMLMARCQTFPLSTRTLHEKLGLLATMGSWLQENHIRPSVLLGIFGLSAHDLSLADQSNDFEFKVLHWLAVLLAQSSVDAEESSVQEWSAIAVEVLRPGADPLALGEGGRTPLCHGLRETSRQPTSRFEQMDCFTSFLRTWAKVVQDSGRDLLAYGAQEAAVWDSKLGLNLIFGDTPDSWSLSACSPGRLRVKMEVLALHPTPGAFPTSPLIPNKICWFPRKAERREGQWARERVLYLECQSSPAQQHPCPPSGSEEITSAQDDAGCLALAFPNTAASSPFRSLTASEEPPTRLGRISQRDSGSRWIPMPRPCCTTGTSSDDRARTAFWYSWPDTDADMPPLSAQACEAWSQHSFLAEIRDCQAETCECLVTAIMAMQTVPMDARGYIWTK
jgi:hypothetical protein